LAQVHPSGVTDPRVEAEAVGKAALTERITVDSEQCGGRPRIRGMRIRMSDVLNLLANGLTPEQILEEMPDPDREDIYACLRFASQRVNHSEVVG
jgi:uncharacterized protein (DUF433 family)